VLDQITKFWTVHTFAPPWQDPQAKIAVIQDWFYLVRVHNQGVAFGFGNGTAWAPIVFLVVPLIALTLLRIFWKKGVFKNGMSKVAVALLISGIFGNLTDRLVQGFLLEEFQKASFWERLSQGYVVDFISVRLPLYDKIVPSSGGWWPSFNVADSCICVAAVLLFIGGIREEVAIKKNQRTA
jgi:signal peptidase II